MPTILEVKIALRSFSKRPALALGRSLTLTVTVAALCSVFAVADATILRRLPYPDAARLMWVYSQPPNTSTRNTAAPLHPITFLRLREHVTVFDQFEGIWTSDRSIMVASEPESIPAGRVSAGFFEMLGAAPVRGRVFTRQEVDQNQRLVVLSHEFWIRRYGGQESVVGEPLLIDGEPHTIVGVVQKGFDAGPARSELWTPLHLRGREGMAATLVQTTARLKADVSAAQASEELTRLIAAVQAESPTMLQGWGINALDLHEFRFGPRRPIVLMLAFAAFALALIAMANLTNLTLSDLLSRRAEFSLKAALGGSPREIIGSEIALAVLIALIGATSGLAAAQLGARWLFATDPWSEVAGRALIIGWRIMILSLVSALIIMVASTVLPILQFTRNHAASDVGRSGSRTAGSKGATRVRFVLLATQSLLAVVLLSTGLLVVSSFNHYSSVSAGFDSSDVVTAQIQLPAATYREHAFRSRFVRQVLERVRQSPGVTDAGATMNPFRENLFFFIPVEVADWPHTNGEPDVTQFRRVTPGYFSTLRIPLVSGRVFDDRDDDTRQPVVVISKTFADRFWPQQDAIGKRIKRGPGDVSWSMVVGVVGDVRDISLLQEPAPILYVPYYQNSNVAAPVGLTVKAATTAKGVDAIKTAVWSLDNAQPLSNIVTLDAFLANSMGSLRFRVALTSLCALAGVLLSGIGIFAIAARSVAERTQEAGIRLALGGSPWTVRWSLVKTSTIALAAGVIAGGSAAIATSSVFRAFAEDLTGNAVLITVSAGFFVSAIGMLSTYWASHHATTVDPLRALRAD